MLFPEVARVLDRAPSSSSPWSLPKEAERIVVRNESGSILHGLLFAKEGDIGTIVVSGGNARSRNNTAEYYRFLIGKGHRVLVISFQGFDENGGEADISSLLGDAYAFLAEIRRRYPEDKVAYVGDSISAAVALCLPAYHSGISAVVVEGAIDPRTISYAKLNQFWFLFPFYPLLFPVAVTVSNTVPSNLAVKECIRSYASVPLLFVHHRKDRIAPYSAASEVSDCYRGPKKFLTSNRAEPPDYHKNFSQNSKLRREALEFLRERLG